MTTFDWEALAQFKADHRFPPDYPSWGRTFFSPEDDVHGVLVSLLMSCQQSLCLNMYGYDDDELDGIIRKLASDPRIYIQISLDSSQAAGLHEHRLLAGIESMPSCNVAIGRSTAHAISHLKVAIVDGLYVVAGSTNWSLSGEQKQDNQLTITNDRVIAAEYRAILDRNHAAMIQQERAKAA